jgi:membrane protease YdiL (CAAX protease family)
MNIESAERKEDRIEVRGAQPSKTALGQPQKWTWSSLLFFEAIVCAISLFFSIVGSVAPQVALTIPARGGFSVSSKTVLLLLSSFVPGAVLLVASRDCRSATFTVRASIGVYAKAILLGFVLPFSSYLGGKIAYPLWDSSTLPTLARVFVINLFLSPLWEEITWRAYFYPKVNSMMRRGPSIVIAALGWTVWHIGFLFSLYHSGVRATILPIFVIQLFLGGIILCSFFTLGRNSLLPCVLLHTAFNASTTAYYRRYNRVNDTGSYVAEAVVSLVVALIVFRFALRKSEDTCAPDLRP